MDICSIGNPPTLSFTGSDPLQITADYGTLRSNITFGIYFVTALEKMHGLGMDTTITVQSKHQTETFSQMNDSQFEKL